MIAIVLLDHIHEHLRTACNLPGVTSSGCVNTFFGTSPYRQHWFQSVLVDATATIPFPLWSNSGSRTEQQSAKVKSKVSKGFYSLCRLLDWSEMVQEWIAYRPQLSLFIFGVTRSHQITIFTVRWMGFVSLIELSRWCGVCAFLLLSVYALVREGWLHGWGFSARNEELGFSSWKVCILGQFCDMARVMFYEWQC